MKQPVVPILMAILLSADTNANAAESVLVTGTYSPQQNLTSSVSVLDQETIQALNKRSLAGLLRTLPGVLVEQQGGPGGLTAVSIRGGESNFTLVLLDGVPVNDPTNSRGGGFDFANLNSALIERVEVVRGAQSAIYGSDALAGVINIITRRPGEGHYQEVYAEGGEDDYSSLSLSASGTVGELQYSLEGVSRDDGEPVQGSSRDTDSVNLHLGWQAAEGHFLKAGYRYLDSDRSSYPEQSGGDQYALSDDLDRSDHDQHIWSLGWTADFSPLWRSSVAASHFEQKEKYQSPGIAPYTQVPPNAADTDFTRVQLQWVNTLQIAAAYQVQAGLDYRDEEGDSVGYLEFGGDRLPTDFELDRSTTGVFLGLTATPIEALLLHGSVRYDDPDDFDSETSSQLGVKYSPGAGVTLAANWGEAYKLPSFFALGHGLVGNPDLQPEQAESWDVGVGWEVNQALRVEASYFSNDYKDLVDFDSENFTNVNRKAVETSGVELQASWQVLAQLNVQAQATYTDLDVKNEDTVLTGRPDWTAGMVARWQLLEQWHTVLNYQYTGEQWAASRHTGKEETRELDDFHRLDWVLRWQPASAWQLQLSVDNLLDEKYQTAVGFSAPERAFRFGVRFSH